MKFTGHISKIRTIRANDPKFIITDGLMVSPRAGFEIDEKCPSGYRTVILECINRGWLRPVANIHGKELTMDAMR